MQTIVFSATDLTIYSLSRWNKISLVAMVVALIATVLGMFWFFRQLSEAGRIPPTMEAPE